uniref:Actin-binding Rho-activating protein n=1 Tax=Oncorhynchus mykiss TaxID=8022 RepID=A0A8C7TR21_ONCMY
LSRKSSTNKNIKKLRTICMVSTLTYSWQHWVSEVNDKQAKEPFAWAPDDLTTGTNIPADQNNPSADQQEKTLLVLQGESRIKTKQVVKTVTSGIQERSVGNTFLTEQICKEAPPPGEEIDRMLSKRGSPSLRRKCSNALELTCSWKEKERNVPSEGEFGDGRTCSVDTEDSRYSEAEERALEQRDNDSVSPKGKIEINALSRKYSAVGDLKSRWQNWSSTHTVNQKLNPFSEDFDYEYSMSLRLRKGEEGYGRPKEGTKTAERARRAEQHIHGEIADMCYVIRTMNDPDPDGKTRVTFRELFDRYVRISDKVVGILLRARRHGKVAFKGEMLWQGQDDGVIITLLV